MNRKSMLKKRFSLTGFTLAELLVALTIIGVITAFMIPKYLATEGVSINKAALKQTISSVNAVLFNGIASGSLTPSNQTTYFLNNLNNVRTCTSNAETQGCWDTPVQGTASNEEKQAGVVLHNGTVVVGLNNFGSEFNGIMIDVNGVNPPNQVGSDQMRLFMCIGPIDCGPTNFGKVVKPGTMAPFSGSAGSVTLFNSLF